MKLTELKIIDVAIKKLNGSTENQERIFEALSDAEEFQLIVKLSEKENIQDDEVSKNYC